MNDDLMALVKLRLEEILTFFEINPKVKLDFHDQTLELNVEGDVNGRLIGRRGETLHALQQIVAAIVKQNTQEHIYVNLDIAGYKAGRAERLGEQVKAEAQKVLETGQPHTLKPMNAAERRIVHMALADMPEVSTDSEGEGLNRRVVIRKRD